MKKNKLILLLSIISLLGTCVAYFYLPDIIPIHWSYDGKVNDWGPKYMAILLGAIPLIIYIIMMVLPRIDPKRENYKKHGGAYNLFIFSIILFLIIVNWISILVALGVKINISLFVPSGVGILFIIIGNYMPQFRHNYFVGIRTPWALADETNWKKTHIYGGYVFIFMGIIMIIIGFWTNPFIGTLGLILIGCALISCYVYSYLIFKKMKN